MTPWQQADKNRAELDQAMGVAKAALTALAAAGPAAARAEAASAIAGLLDRHAEASETYRLICENPPAFRRHPRDGLSDVWRLRRQCRDSGAQVSVLLKQFATLAAETAAPVAAVPVQAPALLPVPALPPVETGPSAAVEAWTRVLTIAAGYFARKARVRRVPPDPGAAGPAARAEGGAGASGREIELIRNSRLFDLAYYRAQFEDGAAPEDPVAHYVETGWRAGRRPNPVFSPSFYQLRYGALMAAIDPLSHYILEGSARQLAPHPLFDTAWFASHANAAPADGQTWLGLFLERDAAVSPHPLFDPAYYAAQACLPAGSARLALLHYLVRGWRSGMRFSPLFDPDHYRSQWPGVAFTAEPFEHFITVGAASGCDPHPLFDLDHYASQHKGAPPADPLCDYVTAGEAAGRSPSPFFDPAFYRDTNLAGGPLAGALAHFLTVGAAADARPIADFDSAAYRATFMAGPAGGGQSAIEHLLRSGLPAAGAGAFLPLLTPPPLGKPDKAAAPAAVVRTGDERPRVTAELAKALNYKEYPGKAKYVPGAPHIMLVAHAAGEHLFGSERSFLDMVNAISAMPANLYVVLPRNVPDYTNAIRPKCRFVSTFTYGWWRKDEAESAEATTLFGELIDSLAIEAVHANTIMLRECLAAARERRVASITHIRELITADEALVALIGRSADEIIDEVRARSDWVIGNSHVTARVFAKPGSTFVVPNTIDIDAMDMPLRDSPPTVRFGLISSNIPKKGLADVVRLAGVAAVSCPTAEFCLIGPETPAVAEIRQRIADGDIPANIVFPGYAKSPAEAIAGLDVVLNFSHFAESFGRTVLEAMAAGRPVIAYEWGALPELIQHGATGYLVPFGRAEDALPFVREFCTTPERIGRLGERGRAVARARFSTTAYGTLIASAYRTILCGREALPEATDGPLIRPARRPGLKTVETAPKIAYFCWHFPVPSETFVLNEIEVLVREGVDVLVFCRQSPHKDFTPGFPVKHERVASAEALAKRLVETGRTIVHAHFAYPTVTDMVRPACEQAGVPFTFIAHAQDIFKYENDRRNQIAEVCASSLCRKVFTLSRFHHDFLLSRGVPRDKIVINPNAVDTSRFAATAMVGQRSRQTRRIVAVHRFVPKKGLDLLIRAMDRVRDLDLTVDLFGYGDLEPDYRALIEELGLPNVTLRGRLTQDEVVETMRAADLFACPSVRTPDGDMDGIPTSVVESMAAGVPVLTTSISGIPDLVADGITGILAEPTPESIADAIRRFYAMAEASVQRMIQAGRERAVERHDATRLVRVLRRVWENRTVDIVVVSWNNLTQLRAVLERVLLNTALPYHLIVCDNQSRRDPVPHYLDHLWAGNDCVTVVHNDRNAMVGPGTNLAMAQGNGDVVIYLCGKEGFSFDNGWEIAFVHSFAEQPKAGLVGTIGRSPTYLTGEAYPKGISLFGKFRNQDFAAANKDRIFGHIQGGLFGIRRAMVDEIGGFSDEVPHDYTDVEYSFYVESRGWQLVEAGGVLALFEKSRPNLSQRFDESIKVAHPVNLDQVVRFDAVRAGRLQHCNLCDWYGETFAPEVRCPSCASTPADRTVFRWLCESPYMYRRLPALAVGLSGPLEKLWGEQFQGPRLGWSEFTHTLRADGRLKNGNGGMRLAIVRGGELPEADRQRAVVELGRLLHVQAPLLVQGETVAPPGLAERLQSGGFLETGRAIYTSAAVRFADLELAIYGRNTAVAAAFRPVERVA